MTAIAARALAGLPEIEPGTDLGELIFAAARDAGEALDGSTIVCVAHKAVSKAEGAVVALSQVAVGDRASELARALDKDPRVVQVVLDQSTEVLRAERGVLITRTRHGLVCANAGVDASNVADSDTVIVLPADPDAAARGLRKRLRALAGGGAGLAGGVAGPAGGGLTGGAGDLGAPAGGIAGPAGGRAAPAGGLAAPAGGLAAPAGGIAAPAVLISDSFGRAWRHGQCDVAIGCAGLMPLDDWRGRRDSVGRELHATWLATADAIAAAADLARAKDSREPVVLLRGLERFITAQDGPGAVALLRPASEDMFL